MKSGSWASYRAAMPPECFGEPDGDEPAGKPDWPVYYLVEWFEPVAYRDEIDGREFEATIDAPVTRWFPVDAHADAWKAACRWAGAMARRHGPAAVHDIMHSGEIHHGRYAPSGVWAQKGGAP